ncbi:hypothetical protein QLX08_008089 [Tetragonisca angustula]|uniref:Uncharacterized protein n=1 Tax=Tetragonisca angustula TaxID=166442 RepID=A0AAW0ZM92_9HYME
MIILAEAPDVRIETFEEPLDPRHGRCLADVQENLARFMKLGALQSVDRGNTWGDTLDFRDWPFLPDTGRRLAAYGWPGETRGENRRCSEQQNRKVHTGPIQQQTVPHDWSAPLRFEIDLDLLSTSATCKRVSV